MAACHRGSRRHARVLRRGAARRPFLAIIHPDDLAETRDVARRLLSREYATSSFEKRLGCKDGRYIWAHITTTLHEGASGTLYFLTDIDDITNRKGAENALRSSEERYRRLFESAKDGILILDVTGLVVDANPFMTELTGYALLELIGKRLWEIGPFQDSGASKSAFAELQDNNYVRYEDLLSRLQPFPWWAPRGARIRQYPRPFDAFAGDLLIALSSSANFISFSSRIGDRRLIGIRNPHLDSVAMENPHVDPITLPNVLLKVIAHELGHSVGLKHNSDPTTLMCGRPAPCRPDIYKSDTPRFFPVTDSDRRRLYPETH
jgi:PAS domain-containing protein